MSDLSSLRYYVEIDKYLFEDEIQIKVNNEKLKEIKLFIIKESKPLYALFIEFSLSNVNSLNEAEGAAQTSLINIIIELSTKYKMYTGNVYLVQYNIIDKGGAILVSNLTVRTPMNDILNVDAKQELIQSLGGIVKSPPTPSGNIAKSLFRVALSNKDVTSKFMLLYLILLYLTQDSRGIEKQKYVDKYIIEAIGETESEYREGPQLTKDKTGYIKETIYTRLRNEIGHYRNADLVETRKEMERTIESLIGIVHRAI